MGQFNSERILFVKRRKHMKIRKRLVSLMLLMVMLMSVVLTGCSGDKSNSQSLDNSSSGEPTYGGSVVVGIQQDIDSLDPHMATAAGTKEILFNIFEGLVKPDENGNLINAVASDYKVSDDGLVYTFTLRDGVKFHNGTNVTAEDVKYSLERASGILDGTPLISALKKIKNVNIVDSKTVEVELLSVDTEMIYNFTAAIIPQGSGESEASQPVGTGPFKFVSYTPQESIIVAKNDDYWQDGFPYLDEVKFKIEPSADTAIMDLKGGSIDIYPYLTDSQATELQKTYNVSSNISNVVQALFMNNNVAPFDNIKVRQAVNYAISRPEINGFVSGGKGAEITSAMLPSLKDYYTDLNSMYTTNIEKAKQLLTEAGYPNGFDMEITVPSNYQFHMDTAQVVVEQLKQVGINAKINGVEWSTWLSDVYNGRQYQTTICGITCDLTPGYLLNRFVTTSAKNFINFNNEEYNEVFAKATATVNMEEKKEYYKQLQTIMAEQAGSAYIQVAPMFIAINKNLGGYKFYPVYVQDMSTVYRAQ